MLLSDRIKDYENIQTGIRLIPNLPVVVRLDGKNFHTWCKNAQRPYDKRVQYLFDETTEFLVQETNAIVGYTQSDEITLIYWNYGNPEAEPFFGGKVFKLNSVLASMATAKFNDMVPGFYPDKHGHLALFDCRVFNVPTLEEAVNCLVWRELDATRNAISMAAQANFSHSVLQGKDSNQMQEMLFQEKGINFNDYPARFKRGGYFKKIEITEKFSKAELMFLPKNHDAVKNPDLEFTRNKVVQLDLPPLLKIKNRVGVIFHGEDVILHSP